MRHILAFAVGVFATAFAAAQTPSPAFVQQPTTAVITQSPEAKTRTVRFADMGQPSGVKLSGVTPSASLNAGVRLDELVTQASLNLKLLYPQGMRHDQSFIRVYVNEQLSAISPLSETKAGALHTVRIDLDPTLLSDFASIRLEYDGTYDTLCRDPANPTLRVDIRPDSTLVLTSSPLPLVNDLALLPAPFFDPRDNSKLKLGLVISGKKSTSNLKAAGVLASWFGAEAFYRQAAFDLLESLPASQHAIVLSTGELLPAGFDSAKLTGPMLYMDSAPGKPWVKHLYVMGRNDDELLQAVYGLVIEGQVLSGQQALIKSVNLGAPRKPYDAPRYVPTDRPVRFAELIDFPNQLEASTTNTKVRLNLRLPPDLFGWSGRNIPINLKYRYTAPSSWNDSLLNIEINSALIQSFRLPPRSEQSQNRLNIDLLGQAELNSEESLQIPAFRVGGNNELSFGFAFAPQGTQACSSTLQTARGAIDPESTLDFSRLPHYTKMPNLTAFANGGYPFTIYADLSDTALVLPANPTKIETEAYLNLMGLFGQWTGLPASRVTVLSTDTPAAIGEKHWLALGTSDRLSWLNDAQMNLPMVLNNTQRSMGMPRMVQWLQNLWAGGDGELMNDGGAKALIETGGALGAIMGFESHLQKQKSGLVLTGTDEESFARAVAALSDYADLAKIKGSVSLVRGDDIQSHQIGKTFVAGSLPWWLRVRIAFTEYPALIAVGGALAGVLLALLAYGWLSRRAGKRAQGG